MAGRRFELRVATEDDEHGGKRSGVFGVAELEPPLNETDLSSLRQHDVMEPPRICPGRNQKHSQLGFKPSLQPIANAGAVGRVAKDSRPPHLQKSGASPSPSPSSGHGSRLNRNSLSSAARKSAGVDQRSDAELKSERFTQPPATSQTATHIPPADQPCSAASTALGVAASDHQSHRGHGESWLLVSRVAGRDVRAATRRTGSARRPRISLRVMGLVSWGTENNAKMSGYFRHHFVLKSWGCRCFKTLAIRFACFFFDAGGGPNSAATRMPVASASSKSSTSIPW